MKNRWSLPTLIFLCSLAVACQPDKKKVKPSTPGTTGARADKGQASIKAILSLGTKGSIGVEVKSKTGSWSQLRVGQGLEAGQTFRATKGTRARLQLGDGSKLLLNQLTEVQLLGKRKIKVISGEVLAQVKPAGKENPMLIETPAGQIKVTGTKLNLKVKSSETVVDVTRGSVEVGGSGAKVEVGAGERAVVVAGKRPRVDLSRDLVETTSWTREIEAPRRDVTQLQEGFGSLTARVPGQGKSHALRLASQKVRVIVRDGIARTEIEQDYYNASGQTLEGTYRFPLPAGASISRLALYVGRTLQEGEIVERKRARQIFAQIVNDTIRPRDPALLEWIGGRLFRMKIFPIPPRSSRRVILAYTQPLNASYGRYRYVYPMATSKGKATKISQFSIDMRLSSTRDLGKVEAPLYPVLREKDNDGVRLRYEASDFVPAASFVVNFGSKGPAPEMQVALYEKKKSRMSAESLTCALSNRSASIQSCGDRGGFFIATLRPELPTTGKARRNDLLFVMDSSHSTGKRGWAVQSSILEAFLAEMDLSSRFNVMACDERCRVMNSAFQKPTAEGRRTALSFLGKLKVGGSSNLQGTFEEAARVAGGSDRPVHVIYLGDGRPTAGEMREPELARLVTAELTKVKASLSAMQVGEDVGELFLQEATRHLGGAIHRIDAGDDLRSRVFEVVAAQYRPTLSNLQVSFEGLPVHHVYPGKLPALTAGSEVTLVGRYDRTMNGAIKLRGTVDGRPFERRYPLTLSASTEESSSNAFIPRVWAKHHLDSLSVANYAVNRPEIVRVSKAYSVLSRATAFLVLENERMYKEFKVKRKRNRTYWKGDKVASRTLSDRKKAEKNKGEEEAKPGIGDRGTTLDGLLSSGSLGGRASGRSGPGGSLQDVGASGAGKASSASRSAKKSRARRDLSDDLDEAPAAEPTATARPRPRAVMKPKTKSRPRPAPMKTPGPRPSKPMSQSAPMDSSGGDRLTVAPRRRRSTSGLGGTRYHRPRVRVIRVPITTIKPILSIPLTRAGQVRQQRLQRQIAARPTSRTLRRAYHRALVKNGRYSQALTHARKWSELDGNRSEPMMALADMQAAAGEINLAIRTFSSTVDVQPWNTRLHKNLARMYKNKGQLDRSCAHVWALMSLHPKRIDNHLKLASCLAQIPAKRSLAMQMLATLARTPMGRRSAARIGKALSDIGRTDGPARIRRKRGQLEIQATWNRPVDLDVALVTPRGRRISAFRGNRRGGVTTDSLDGSIAEALVQSWIRNGKYRVEIARADAAGSSDPVTGTLIIKARGKTQAIPFVISGKRKPVAAIELSTKIKRQINRPFR